MEFNYRVIEADDLIKLETREILKNLFPRDPKLEEELAEDMRQKGYDRSKPIIVWKIHDADGSVRLIIVDGYTRFYAAIKAHVSILIVEMEFANEDEAIRYAYWCQLKRRNLTTAQMMEYIQRFEHLSSRQVANELKISPSAVQRIRMIAQKGSPELQQAVKDGEKSVYAAAEELRAVASQAQDQKEQPASVDAAQGKKETEEVSAVPNTPQDENEQPTSAVTAHGKEENEEKDAAPETPQGQKEEPASTDAACNEGEVEKKNLTTLLRELKEDIRCGKKPESEWRRELILSNYSQKELEERLSELESNLDILFLYDEGRLMNLLGNWIKKHLVPKEVAEGNSHSIGDK